MTSMNRLLIIDGNAMMHRAYHAIPPLTAPDGSVVNVVYGFATMLLRLYDVLAPQYVAVTFDRPTPTFRKTLFTGYQSKRPKMEESLVEQIPKVHALVEAFDIPIFEKDGFEADDVIGTLAMFATKNKRQAIRNKKGTSHVSCLVPPDIDQVIIVTGDRDILQLVDGERIMVYMPTKGLSEGKIYQDADVVTRLGIYPKQIADFKGLAGDSSDNYPGVGGIGPKTAIDLLSKFHSIEGVYTFIDSLHVESGIMNTELWKKQGLSQGTLEKLVMNRDMAFMSKDLATIRTNVALTISLSPITTLNTEKSRNALSEFHFHSLLKRMGVKSITSEVGMPNAITAAATENVSEEKPKGEQQELF